MWFVSSALVKFWSTCSQVDDRYGYQHLVCSCPPRESYNDEKIKSLHKNVTEQYRGAIFRALPRNPWDIVLVGMYLGTPGFGILKSTNNLSKIDEMHREFN